MLIKEHLKGAELLFSAQKISLVMVIGHTTITGIIPIYRFVNVNRSFTAEPISAKEYHIIPKVILAPLVTITT